MHNISRTALLALAGTFACNVSADSKELDLSPFHPAVLECVTVDMPLSGPGVFCSTTVDNVAGTQLSRRTRAYVVKQGTPAFPVAALVLSADLTEADHRAIGSAFEGATHCIWEREKRIVRIDGVYVALATIPVEGMNQPMVAVMTPAAAEKRFGDGRTIGDCVPAL